MWLFLWPIAFCLETVSRQDGEVPENSHPIFHLIGRIVLLPGILHLVLRVLFLVPRGFKKSREEGQPSTWLFTFLPLPHDSASSTAWQAPPRRIWRTAPLHFQFLSHPALVPSLVPVLHTALPPFTPFLLLVLTPILPSSISSVPHNARPSMHSSFRPSCRPSCRPFIHPSVLLSLMPSFRPSLMPLFRP